MAAFHQSGRLSAEQMEEALRLSRQWRSPLPDMLAAMYGISSFEWAQQMAKSCNLPLADLREIRPDASLVSKNDRGLYLQHMFLPWRIDEDGALIIAACSPDDEAIQALVAGRCPGNPPVFSGAYW